ncbi:MAG: glycoside hydrolase family 3 C-terminal domain-containing protein [Oscillospiraceae bacterium]|nr:glycoside hydrolase family 3 C-terminal domain-containing protein [Oscillospiraceae bacterium]
MKELQINGRAVTQILAELTLEEKAAFLDGRDFWHLKDLERLGIPAIMVCDGPHGLRKQTGQNDQLGFGASVPATSFPTASLTACSWDIALLEELGAALGEEARANAVSVLLGPGVNIKRSPLCGRNFEYFSEDPHLAGELAAAWVRGVQQQGVGTSLKHYAVNNQETRRLHVDAVVDERALRELYLPAFERTVTGRPLGDVAERQVDERDGAGNVFRQTLSAQPWTVMNSYNKINGTHGSENQTLQWDILRGDWGFDGLVVSDWGAVSDRVSGVKAGNDVEMPSSFGLRTKQILDAVAAGDLDEKIIDERVIKVLELIAKSIPNLQQQWDYDRAAHHSLARKIAGESMVLLKNDGILPLKEGAKIAVIGEMAKSPRYQGSGSSQINPDKLDSFCGILDEAGIAYTYAQGYEKKPAKKSDPASLIPEAVQTASAADVVLLFIGLTEDDESEGFDRKTLDLPAQHNALAQALLAANPNTVIVLSGGAPVLLPWLSKAPAVLNAYLSGQAGAGAVWDVLTGAVNPSGKLAETYPTSIAATGSAANFPGDPLSVQYRESLYVGYRYHDKTGREVQFPFGYGLSYTAFDYSGLQVSKQNLTDSDTLRVSCSVANTGGVDGAETLQLYVANDGKAFRPVRELKGFAKVFLKAGESRKVSFDLNKRAFAIWDTVNKEWRVPSGEYMLQIGGSSAETRLSAAVTLNSASEPAEVNVPEVYKTGDPATVSAEDFAALLGRELPPGNKPAGEPIGPQDTFELAAHTKWGGRIYRTIRRLTALSPMGDIMFAEVTGRPFHLFIYYSAGLFTAEALSGLLQILNGKRAGNGLWKIVKTLPHLLLNVKRVLKMAF